MDLQPKTSPRRRVANFTAEEKILLTQLIKNMPIVESKLTDGKSVAKKQAAWETITQEFNCNANVHKRETLTLKRAWDNMKAFTRKARAEQRGNLLRTGGGPNAGPPLPQHGGKMSMVKEAAPDIFCEITNTFDSDGAILDSIINKNKLDQQPSSSVSVDTMDIFDSNIFESEENKPFEDANKPQIEAAHKSTAEVKTIKQVRRPNDYIRREAEIRIKHLEHKKKMEMQILKTQLEVEQIKKRTALLDEEKNRMLLEKAKIELEELKKSLIKQESIPY